MYSTSVNSTPYPPPPQGYTPYGQPGIFPEQATSQSHDTGAAIDPALGGAARHEGSPHDNTDSVDPQGHRGRGLSWLGCWASLALPSVKKITDSRIIAKRTKIEELLCIDGYNPPAPAPPSTLPDSTKSEIQQIWGTAYAPGMDKFFETKWFTARGLHYLTENTRLCNQFATLVQRYSTLPQDPHYYHSLGITRSLEATVVWAMLGLCRQVSSKEPSQINEEDVKEGVHDAARRLEVFEALVTGEYLASDSVPQPSSVEPKKLETQMQERTQSFWRLVHKFVTIRDDEASAAKEIDDTLAGCRSLLDAFENRDVTYSIMVVRHVGARMAEALTNGLKDIGTNDEDDARAKLGVAKTFILDEANTRGTNQVVQRLCGMAARSWAPMRR